MLLNTSLRQSTQDKIVVLRRDRSKMKFAVAIVFTCLVAVALAASKCEEERAKNGGQRVGAFIPSCEADGSYSARQCHGSTGMCWCAREDGSKINEPARGKYDECKCARQKDVADQTNLIGAFNPQCQENGNFNAKQCWASTGTCWCVNEKTGLKNNNQSC